MTALPTATVPPEVAARPLAESRPPCRRWSSSSLIAVPRAGPSSPVERASVPARPRHGEGRVSVVRADWTVDVDPDLPDVTAWSGSLAVAMVEALLSRRPVAQLNRWLSAEVLASVTLQQRRRRSGSGSSAAPGLVCARVQHPAARVAEVSAFLRVGRRPLVLAFRLEALGARWLCTALEIGPAPAEPTPAEPARSLRRQHHSETAEGEPQQRCAGS